MFSVFSSEIISLFWGWGYAAARVEIDKFPGIDSRMDLSFLERRKKEEEEISHFFLRGKERKDSFFSLAFLIFPLLLLSYSYYYHYYHY